MASFVRRTASRIKAKDSAPREAGGTCGTIRSDPGQDATRRAMAMNQPTATPIALQARDP
jgi:hypothetical protein